ncbi:MAG: radical SAM protein [Acutalibacteraceae bacterium]|nr:radical SAM protein [Acutalibacteraceae bacterium]
MNKEKNTFRSNDAFPQSVNNQFWNDLRKQAANNYIPIHGHFEITPRCNLNCKMCYVHLNNTQMGKLNELPFLKWKEIVDQAIHMGMLFASISGGECLTSPYFDELYLYLKSKGIIVFVLTNGVLLDKKISLFEKYPPALIQVSVYGYDKASYIAVTEKDEYDNVSNSIEKAHKLGLPISVAVTASRYLPSVYEIVKKYYEIGIGVTVNRWIMPPYESTGRKFGDINLSPDEQVNISKEILQATEQELIPCPVEPLPKPIMFLKDRAPKKGLLCAAGRSDFSINWKGEMSLCVSLNTPTGYPLIDGFKKAWEQTVIASKEFLMPVECYECKYLKVCNRCPAQHLINNLPGHCNPAVCEEGILMVKNGLVSL